MKKFFLYYKYQFKLLIGLIGIVLLPLALVYQFSPYEWENLYWLVLTFLFALKIIFYKEAPYKKELSQSIRPIMIKELNRTPSKMEVVNRIEDMITARDVVIITVGALVIFLTIGYGKF